MYTEAILRAAKQLAAGQGLNYRERLGLERAVYRLTSRHAKHALDWTLDSMGAAARREFVTYCEHSGVQAGDARVDLVHCGFEVMRLIASIANADPYVLNENISRVIHRYSTGVASLPSLLREFVDRHAHVSLNEP
jgi:hypothetical protein